MNRIARLIGDIDRINELESQYNRLQLTRFDLAALTRRIAAGFEALANEKALKLIVEGETVPIQADEDKISQVVTNLLVNAIKFTPADGTIRIQVLREQDKAVFRIQDTGEGISPDDLGKVFERFFMTDPSRSRKLGGKGIGLSIVKSLVQAHGGEITVDSVLGKGTTFTVHLLLIRKRRAPRYTLFPYWTNSRKVQK